MEFSRQEYRGGLPFPSPADLPNPEIEPSFPALQADALPSEPPGRNFDIFRLHIFSNYYKFPLQFFQYIWSSNPYRLKANCT